MLDPALKEELLKAVQSKIGGVELSAIYHKKLLEKFSKLPHTEKALKDNPCILFAVGSVGRMEGVYGSDLEVGLFCKNPVSEETQKSIHKSIELDVPGMIWDHEFTIPDNIFSSLTFETDLPRIFPSKLLKLLDATPIAYINCNEDIFSFQEFRTVFLKYILLPNQLKSLLKSTKSALKGDFVSIESVIEENVIDQGTQEQSSAQQFVNLDPPTQKEILFRNPTPDTDLRNPLLYQFDLKESFYRPLSTSIMALYLKLCAQDPTQCTPLSWRTSSQERLQCILDSSDHSIMTPNSRNVMDTFLALRMGARTQSEQNRLTESDFSNHLFFGSIPEEDVFKLFSTILKLRENQPEIFKSASPQ